MRLLPKSIHWCRRYPTKFNSGRDIPRCGKHVPTGLPKEIGRTTSHHATRHIKSAHSCYRHSWGLPRERAVVLFFTLNREDFSFVIHLDRQPRTSRRREAQTGSRARSGSRSERTLDAVEHSRTLMEWWPFLIFHRGGLRIKVINNTEPASIRRFLAKKNNNPSRQRAPPEPTLNRN